MSEEPKGTEGDRRSEKGWLRDLPWKAVAAVIASLSALTAVVAVLVPTPLFAPEPSAMLQVSSFDVGRVTRSVTVTADSGEEEVLDTFHADVARVQIGLRNRGEEPAYITRAILTVSFHEPLTTCVQIGDAVFVTESVDVQLPFETPELPWVLEQPVSFQVRAGQVDRLEFTFGMADVPIARQPVLIAVRIDLVQDTAEEPLEAGTAKLLVPNGLVRTALDSLSADPMLVAGVQGTTPEIRTCNELNQKRVQAFINAPTGKRSGLAPSLLELTGAQDAYARGKFYTPPAQPSP